MANPMKGEVGFEAGGREYTFLLDWAAILALEDAFDATMGEVAFMLEQGARAKDQLRVFKAGLKARHAALDDAAIIALASELGAAGVPKILGKAIRSAYEIPDEEKDPDADAGAADEGDARPPQDPPAESVYLSG